MSLAQDLDYHPPPNQRMELTVQLGTRLAKTRARLAPICSAAHPGR
jgi:hypothetical protein